MENFIVSARKYRPQTFDTVVGQKSITNTLKNAIRNNQLAQAFLFCGPRGIGKTTCARILAKTINCENLSPNIEACDKCPSCVSFNENASFNIYELDGASNNSVDEIRNLVDKVRIPPQMGKYKVYIIDEVHMLSASAFNAFLKTLEEPPAYAKFILATTEKHKIIPTILSRCQIFDFKRITADDIVTHLKFVADKEGIDAEEHALHIIAQKADGAMRDALSIFDQLVSFAGNKLTYNTVLENLNVLDYEFYFQITSQILECDISNILLTINEILEKGFDGQHFLIGFGQHLRNLLVCKDPITVKLLETAPSIRSRYEEQARLSPVDILLKLLDINNRCDLNYKISNNKRLHLELALMQMGSLLNQPVAAPMKDNESKPVPVKTPTSPENKMNVPQKPAISQSQEHVRPKDMKSFPSTISIKETKKEENKPGDNGSDVVEETRPSYRPADDFTQTHLETAWDEFAEIYHMAAPDLYNALKKHPPILKENFAIEFYVENKLLEEKLNQKRNELLLSVMSKLNNFSITLQILVIETPKGSKPYTDREKFDHMAAKNPTLLNLREELDLDV
ncbi:MAG: DNA polymerase III subunit gamma/tau [Bacteroidetes bacterium]|nr:DNA polymerase III subunit gamma/tau [Bacteroidota bacterium]